MSDLSNMKMKFTIIESDECYFTCKFRNDSINEHFIADQIHNIMIRNGFVIVESGKSEEPFITYKIHKYAGNPRNMLICCQKIDGVMTNWRHRLDTWAPDPLHE